MENIAFHRYFEFSGYFVAPVSNSTIKNKDSHKYTELSGAALSKYIAKCEDDLQTAIEDIISGKTPCKPIFTTNSKLRGIYNIKILPGKYTCSGICGKCLAGCYAVKNQNRLPGSRAIAAHNTAVLKLNPKAYFDAIRDFTATQKEFRWHESGEVANEDYFRNVIAIAANNPDCEYLLYTKRLEYIREYRGIIASLKNLHVVASCMDYQDIEKSANLGVPRTLVNYSHNGVPAKYRKPLELPYGANVYGCKSDCSECKKDGLGCWNKATDHITVFEAHN